ncbi:Uncharacterised protein [Vibrio cholerae]|nr:Uncharacterised protein [Vibrio cholerae]
MAKRLCKLSRHEIATSPALKSSANSTKSWKKCLKSSVS